MAFNDIFPLLVIPLTMLAWGIMFVVPASLAGARRRKGRPIYLAVLLAVLAVELVVALGLLQVSTWFGKGFLWVLASPLLATSAASYIYWTTTKNRDKALKSKT